MNYCLAIMCLFALAATSKADGTLDGLIYAPGHASLEYYANPSYAFEYAVNDPHTGDNKAQWEKREGDNVKGAYSLVEPDGSLRVVEYWADAKSGFNAVVKRIGPNLHPVAAPIYKAPIPVLSQAAVAPVSVGSAAKIDALASAPLISGPVYGGAVSSAAVYNAGPSAPSLNTPILSEPTITEPYYNLQNPIYTEPTYKTISLSAPLYSTAIEKTAPYLQSPGLAAPRPLLKDSFKLSSLSSLGESLQKNSLLGSGYVDDFGYGSHLTTLELFGLKH